jgi:hypothetical protein
MCPLPTPEEYADEWNKDLKAALDKIRRGVDKVDVAPSSEAIKKKDKMKANLMNAIESGIWERRLSKYTLDQWKEDMKEKAVARIPGGADAAKDKMRDVGSKLLPYIAEGIAKVERLPDLTLEDSINRAAEFIRHMAKFKLE